METVTDFFFFLSSKITANGDCSHEIERLLLLGIKAMTNIDSTLKSRDSTLPTYVHLVKAMAFPVVMYGCESWTIKKAEHWRIHAFELWCWRRFKSPLDCKQIQPVNPKGNQSWIFIGRADAEAETPILWPPNAKNWFIWKDPDAGKDWRQEEKGMTEDGIVGYHHWLDGHEFDLALGVGEGQGSKMCCNPWGCKELDMTEQLNWCTLFADSILQYSEILYFLFSLIFSIYLAPISSSFLKVWNVHVQSWISFLSPKKIVVFTSSCFSSQAFTSSGESSSWWKGI